MTLNWKPRFRSFFSICWVMLSKPTWLRGYTDCCGACLSRVAIVAKGFNEGKDVDTDLQNWPIYVVVDRKKVVMKGLL